MARSMSDQRLGHLVHDGGYTNTTFVGKNTVIVIFRILFNRYGIESFDFEILEENVSPHSVFP